MFLYAEGKWIEIDAGGKRRVESNRWRGKTCTGVEQIYDVLWTSELLVQVEFGHLALVDPQRTICMRVGNASAHVRGCVYMWGCMC